MAKIFISYKRNVEPDTLVAQSVYDALSGEHDVFIDTTIQVGERWADQIQRAIKESDFLVIFLSEHSVTSEMVLAEVETAHQHSKSHSKPLILPVRLKYAEPLVYPISAYLNPLQWVLWNQDADTPNLIASLRKVISGGTLTVSDPVSKDILLSSTSAETPTALANIVLDSGALEGTMPHRSPFYVERDSDRDAIKALCEMEGVTITIKGPRQMGKSSLLNRLMVDSCGDALRTAFVDFQMIESTSIMDASVFYRQFCSSLSWEFGIEDKVDAFWKSPLGQVQKTTNYIQNYLFKEIKNPRILLAMDEVERMFSSPFRSDFFSMLRSWHNNRARGGDWKRFNMALVTSTEPYQFIADLNQSPFNVGQVVELADFTFKQVTDLNLRHHSPISNSQLQQLFDLLNGHPYLTRKALFLLASGRTTFADLMKNACEDNGPFGDHLRNYLFRMSDQDELKRELKQVLRRSRCSDEHVFFQLRGAGLVKRVGNSVQPRNHLYAKYFAERLHE
jgi:hypothetical protein